MSLLLEAFRNALSGDEFYTKYSDIQKELSNYDFSNMIVYCNCDKPDSSNFVKFFKDNFSVLGLKKLMATFSGTEPFLYEFDGIKDKKTEIASGRFQDNIELIRQCDIIATNPPFFQWPSIRNDKFINTFRQKVYNSCTIFVVWKKNHYKLCKKWITLYRPY